MELQMDAEVWKPLPCDADYQISDRGRVRSRRGRNGLYLPDGEWRVCKLTPHCKGYLQVSINGVLRLVHDLVLLAHVGPPQSGEQACHHPDPDKTNNNLCNLSWGPGTVNMQQLAQTGRVAGQKLTPPLVYQIRNETDGKPLTREVLRQASQKYGVTPAAIKNIKYRQTWAWLP